ncbi:hypothetical protein BLNAU_1521 [Blattamonas nauphoetae]|uniref:RRM domain-containing protein n=1 Tax=Blattamonas nauphoetae TaxID=2049346 RepID=A0ABQ9YI94_9EUKA|nr:hypothetical protein BLNAU_1521 [Blattamonas nauphoetae]
MTKRTPRSHFVYLGGEHGPITKDQLLEAASEFGPVRHVYFCHPPKTTWGLIQFENPADAQRLISTGKLRFGKRILATHESSKTYDFDHSVEMWMTVPPRARENDIREFLGQEFELRLIRMEEYGQHCFAEIRTSSPAIVQQIVKTHGGRQFLKTNHHVQAYIKPLFPDDMDHHLLQEQDQAKKEYRPEQKKDPLILQTELHLDLKKGKQQDHHQQEKEAPKAKKTAKAQEKHQPEPKQKEQPKSVAKQYNPSPKEVKIDKLRPLPKQQPEQTKPDPGLSYTFDRLALLPDIQHGTSRGDLIKELQKVDVKGKISNVFIEGNTRVKNRKLYGLIVFENRDERDIFLSHGSTFSLFHSPVRPTPISKLKEVPTLLHHFISNIYTAPPLPPNFHLRESAQAPVQKEVEQRDKVMKQYTPVAHPAPTAILQDKKLARSWKSNENGPSTSTEPLLQHVPLNPPSPSQSKNWGRLSRQKGDDGQEPPLGLTRDNYDDDNSSSDKNMDDDEVFTALTMSNDELLTFSSTFNPYVLAQSELNSLDHLPPCILPLLPPSMHPPSLSSQPPTLDRSFLHPSRLQATYSEWTSDVGGCLCGLINTQSLLSLRSLLIPASISISHPPSSKIPASVYFESIKQDIFLNLQHSHHLEFSEDLIPIPDSLVTPESSTPQNSQNSPRGLGGDHTPNRSPIIPVHDTVIQGTMKCLTIHMRPTSEQSLALWCGCCFMWDVLTLSAQIVKSPTFLVALGKVFGSTRVRRGENEMTRSTVRSVLKRKDRLRRGRGKKRLGHVLNEMEAAAERKRKELWLTHVDMEGLNRFFSEWPTLKDISPFSQSLVTLPGPLHFLTSSLCTTGPDFASRIHLLLNGLLVKRAYPNITTLSLSDVEGEEKKLREQDQHTAGSDWNGGSKNQASNGKEADSEGEFSVLLSSLPPRLRAVIALDMTRHVEEEGKAFSSLEWIRSTSSEDAWAEDGLKAGAWDEKRRDWVERIREDEEEVLWRNNMFIIEQSVDNISPLPQGTIIVSLNKHRTLVVIPTILLPTVSTNLRPLLFSPASNSFPFSSSSPRSLSAFTRHELFAALTVSSPPKPFYPISFSSALSQALCAMGLWPTELELGREDEEEEEGMEGSVEKSEVKKGQNPIPLSALSLLLHKTENVCEIRLNSRQVGGKVVSQTDGSLLSLLTTSFMTNLIDNARTVSGIESEKRMQLHAQVILEGLVNAIAHLDYDQVCERRRKELNNRHRMKKEETPANGLPPLLPLIPPYRPLTPIIEIDVYPRQVLIRNVCSFLPSSAIASSSLFTPVSFSQNPSVTSAFVRLGLMSGCGLGRGIQATTALHFGMPPPRSIVKIEKEEEPVEFNPMIEKSPITGLNSLLAAPVIPHVQKTPTSITPSSLSLASSSATAYWNQLIYTSVTGPHETSTIQSLYRFTQNLAWSILKPEFKQVYGVLEKVEDSDETRTHELILDQAMLSARPLSEAVAYIAMRTEESKSSTRTKDPSKNPPNKDEETTDEHGIWECSLRASELEEHLGMEAWQTLIQLHSRLGHRSPLEWVVRERNAHSKSNDAESSWWDTMLPDPSDRMEQTVVCVRLSKPIRSFLDGTSLTLPYPSLEGEWVRSAHKRSPSPIAPSSTQSPGLQAAFPQPHSQHYSNRQFES